ncbi:hypothetical protein GH810_14480 [Acetobacterium paludosum]|uniref:Bacteriophage tail tape measure N-terminal domain-containing protein n=1 Tax=Acetobacterium paludosum TaxID=52693 RepID=A0A923HXQ0_9FIRM|nr:phage tail length tape measure family protein [Acetobacterium paludosum]MBC3889517.1 hypothetical protein [Acetobacterium paludosum]
MADLRSLFFSIGFKGDASGINSMNKATDSLKSSMSSVASVAVKAAAILGAGIGIKDMVQSAAAGQQRMAQMDAVLASTGSAAGMSKDALLSLADAQGKVTEYSKGATIEAENMMLTFTGVGSDVFPTAIKASQDMATAMGMDATSAAQTLGKALNDPEAGLSRLTKQGVVFTDAQKDQIAAMQNAAKQSQCRNYNFTRNYRSSNCTRVLRRCCYRWKSTWRH